MNTGIPSMDARSLAELAGVKPKLQGLIHRFSRSPSCPYTFIVPDGVRTVDEQKVLVERGASKTMRSKHLTGDAVDIAIVIHGKVRWEWDLYVTFMEALRKFAREEGVKIIWGGCWIEITGILTSLPTLVDHYKKQCREKRRKPLLDGPHIELA